MTSFSLTLQEEHFDILKKHLIRKDGNERLAYLLCSKAEITRDPWNQSPHQKFLSYKVICIEDNELLSSSPQHVSWLTDTFVSMLREAKAKNFIVAVVHSHPLGSGGFSSTDDKNEPDLVQLAVNRNGLGTSILSLILDGNGTIWGRIWETPYLHHTFTVIRIFGNRFHFIFADQYEIETSKIFHRQVLAFGKSLTKVLGQLRVGIVGCGGTGSAVAMLLSRIGLGHLILIDKDVVDITNLNRLHGARKRDADAQLPKVEVIARAINELEFGIKVETIQAWVNDSVCRDALKSCDLIFGCSDDNQGRLLLNRMAYYYLVPVIDVGLGIEVTKSDPPEIRTLDGRVTVLGPHNTCLLCLGIINSQVAYSEGLRRSHPEEYERRKIEAYVLGEGEPSPAVVTFTTEVATMAVNELLHRIQGFRSSEGVTAHRTRLFHRMHDLRPGDEPSSDCNICGQPDNWGRGDIIPFLDRVE